VKSQATVSLLRWLRRQLREPTPQRERLEAAIENDDPGEVRRIVGRMSFNDAQRRHIDGLLDRWERERAEAVIDDLEREPDPAVRLKKLLGATFKRAPSDRAEIALLADPGHPAALRAVRRAAGRRITYISQQLEALGWTRADAHDRAVLLYYIYVGYLQMAHAAPEVISGGADQRRQAGLVFDALAAHEPQAAPPRPR